MQTKEETITKFYTAFGQLDYSTMNSQYADDIVFSDPVFGILEGEEVKNMWEMLCKNAKDFSLTFSNIQTLDHEYATCNWTATYTFSKTGRKVVNHIKAHMRFRDGIIIEHSDAFKISKWAAQALGLKGVFFGWTNFLKRKIKLSARKNLALFVQKKNSEQTS